MYSFTISRPATVAEAVNAMNSASDVSALAGGMTLIPTLKMRLANPDALVDLSHVSELNGITVTDERVSIGAMTTHGAVAENADIAAAIPALAALAGHIGDPAVRHRGTLGGSVANSDPAADYPAAVLGLGATINTTRRSIGADDYFKGLFETALDEGELITSIDFPRVEACAYQKFAQPASRYALVGVMVARTSGGARVAVTGAGACAFRVPQMEAALNAHWSGAAVSGIRVSADGLNSDIHGSARYRAHLVTVLAERAIAAT